MGEILQLVGGAVAADFQQGGVAKLLAKQSLYQPEDQNSAGLGAQNKFRGRLAEIF
jgi:hypothetical protein